MWTIKPGWGSGPTGGDGLRALVRAGMGAILVTWGVVSTHEALPVAPEESLLLAWVRLAAEHDVRTSVALFSIFWALAPGPRALERTEGAEVSGAGKDPPARVGSPSLLLERPSREAGPPHRIP